MRLGLSIASARRDVRRSLMPIVTGVEEEVRDAIFAEGTYHAAYEPQRAIRTPRWKLVRRFGDRRLPVLPNIDDSPSKQVWLDHGYAEREQAPLQLYDLVFDPNEACNVADRPEHAPVVDHLSTRLTGTRWEPLLWAAPWLWRTSGNPFLDRDDDDYPEPEPWSASGVFYLTALYREALRIMRAVDGFDTWLLQAPAERTRAAVQAAMGAPSNRISTLLDLPIADRHAGRHCPLHMAPAP